MKSIDAIAILIGRFLLGLYFLLPGIQKITNFEMMSQYMSNHEVPFVPVLLVITIILQIGGGLALIVGFKGKYAAYVLAGLTLIINLYMHSFWHLPEGANVQHETQNFVKNLAIMAGLLVLAAHGTGRFSLDGRLQKEGT